MANKENTEVIKHSASIQITNKINLLQRQAWNILLANAYYDLPRKDTYTIEVQELTKVLQFDSKNDKYLKEALKALVSCIVEWNVFEKDKQVEWGATALLSYCSIKDGICTYRYDSFVREQLYNPSIYARISLLIQNKFKSKHSLALYELCIDYLGAKREEAETPFLELNKFKKLMGLKETEYPDFEKLNLWVIKVAITEINTVSDITIRVEYQKARRRVIGIKFHITLKMGKYINPDLQLPLIPNFPPPESKLIEAPKIKKSHHSDDMEKLSTDQKKAFKQLLDIGISKAVIQNLIKTYPLENLKKQIEWLEYREPKDPAALLIRAIKEEWAMPKELKKAEDEKNEKIKIEKMVQLAENANYIIFPDGKKYKILSVLQDSGFIEILKDDKKVMVRPQIAFECSFA